MSALPNTARRVARQAQARSADVMMKAASHKPFAQAVGVGIASEGWMSRFLASYQTRTARMLGYATRSEVRRLRELVRALEYRLELVEGPATPKDAGDGTADGKDAGGAGD